MVIEPRTLRGFRDFLPQEAMKRRFLAGKIAEVMELFGFEPLETPALEYEEILTGQIGDGEKMIFRFEDEGGRKVALRYDQTVPTCRFIAEHRHEIVLPWKRYQIQPVWRAEKPQKGRFREFIHCDADVFGVEEAEADTEVLALTAHIFEVLGFNQYEILLNDRALYENIPYEAVVAIDKLEKVGKTAVIEEMKETGIEERDANKYLDQVLNAKPNQRIKNILDYMKAIGYGDKIRFAPEIARSFSYSTGPIWEVKVPGYKGGSVLGGERYDSLVSRFADWTVSGTGFAVGFDRTYEAMEKMGLFPEKKTVAGVIVLSFSSDLFSNALELAMLMRKNGIKTDLYLEKEEDLNKQLRYADKKGYRYVIIQGPDELKRNGLQLKNMKTGEQEFLSCENESYFFYTIKKKLAE